MAVKLPIYMDNAATTRTDPRVVEAMLPYFTEKFGNSASRNHKFGWEAEDAVDLAREQAAALIGASPKEIVWTSGSTESNNLAIKGAARMYAKGPEGTKGRGHIIAAAHEHKAVLDPCKRLQHEGFDVTFLTPPPDGVITRAMVAEAMREDTILVSIMWANNETGAITDIARAGAICREHGVRFYTDATQWVGKMPTDLAAMQLDLASFAAHKLHGPKGVGALYVRRNVRVTPHGRASDRRCDPRAARGAPLEHDEHRLLEARGRGDPPPAFRARCVRVGGCSMQLWLARPVADSPCDGHRA